MTTVPSSLARLTALLGTTANTAGTGQSYAVVRRENSPHVDLLVGDTVDVDSLDDIPLPDEPGPAGHHVLALVPFRQIRERGFEAHDDGTPLRCLRVAEHHSIPLGDVLAALPDVPVVLDGGAFDIDDESYAAVVKRVVADEIGRGEGANFVVRRDWTARLHDHSPAHLPQTAATLLRRLLTGERGAYWTYLVHTPGLTLVGASPERHVSALGGEVVMNPISGTYRYPPQGASRAGLEEFLTDTKEVDELFMVVDEELKMMSEVCNLGGRVEGPYLKEMGHLAHTEYVLRGHSSQDVRAVLRGTMFAPTLTGSPLENACRVIRRHEATGRGYYGGVLALFGSDGEGRRTLDAPILIRTLYISPDGVVRVPAGATLVRHSQPENEVAETHAKAAGVFAALGVVRGAARPQVPAGLADDPGIARLLASRNAMLAPFWTQEHTPGRYLDAALAGRRALVVDAEDAFTAMLAHLLRSLGLEVTVRPHDGVDEAQMREAELVVLGPGPGDPRDLDVPRVRAMRDLARVRLGTRQPLLAVCLGHQAVCAELGLPLVRREVPYQGRQVEVELFGGRRERVGFYNTFTAMRPGGRVLEELGAEVACDPVTGYVHALRVPHLRVAGVQFHPESVLTTDGTGLVAELTKGLLYGG